MDDINEELLDFLQESPTAFHAVSSIRKQLNSAGYKELSEGKNWRIEAGGKYFVARNESSLIAFRIPNHDPAGFMICASHSDSPAFKIKTNPEICGNGYVKLNVEGYGGMLMSPWFDRPLSAAGRVIVRSGNHFETRLVNIDRDLLLIPSLAIHMDRNANKGHPINPQQELLPMIGSEVTKGDFAKAVAAAAGVVPEEIVSADLYLYARGRGHIFGIQNEFLCAGHLDDLQCTFSNLKGFLHAQDGSSIPVMAVFDNEEVGSLSKQGADSTFLKDVLDRILSKIGKDDDQKYEMLADTFLVSADNAHAVHPNYPDKADPVNRPHLNEGVVIKYNAAQKYTTDAVSAAVFKEICRQAQVPFQEFTNRSDMPGGSTLGNISNSHVSVNAVDIGLPQLAMHSPVETAGTKDTAYLIRALEKYFSLSFRDEGKGSWLLQ